MKEGGPWEGAVGLPPLAILRWMCFGSEESKADYAESCWRDVHTAGWVLGDVGKLWSDLRFCDCEVLSNLGQPGDYFSESLIDIVDADGTLCRY